MNATRIARVLAGAGLLIAGTAMARTTPYDELLAEAAVNGPAVQAAHQEWVAERARADATGKLPDPRLTYGHFLQPVETRIGPQEHQLALQQTVPWFGSLGRERAAVASAARAARARLHATWLEVELDVTRTLHELHRLDHTLELERDAFDLLQQFEDVARTRLRVNQSTTADLLRLQVELGRAEDRLRRLEDQRAPVVARLNALLDRPRGTDVEITPPLRTWPALAPRDSLDLRLQRNHPGLRALQFEIERQERRTDVARDRGRPDLTLGLVHTFVDERDVADLDGNGDDATLATVSIDLPLWRGKIGAGVREAQRRRAAGESRYRRLHNELDAALEQALYELDDAERRVELYETTLVPKAEESLGATLDAYANGRSDFGELIDVQRTLLTFQRQLLEARVDRANARARVESLVPDPAAIRTALAHLEESR
jgi:outer membrane protein TolC